MSPFRRWTLILAAAALAAQPPQQELLKRNRPVVDAHNCYPYDGRWSDRIDRALSAGYPVSIEQDLTWYTGPGSPNGRLILAHNPKAITGQEPGVREHFFERVRPIVEKALKDGNKSEWPILILHFDFKTNDAPLLDATWKLLGEYEGWITTARKSADANELTAVDSKPILVLTEDSDVQEDYFYKRIPVGSKLRLFGSAHTSKFAGDTVQERAHSAVAMTPEQLLTERPTTYRRWWNCSWHIVEEGGQTVAGDWTSGDDARLQALVKHSHERGFPIRFFAIDGFLPTEDRGWDRIYNFGTREAALLRWKAAVAAGVDMIATDQYEELAAAMGRAPVK